MSEQAVNDERRPTLGLTRIPELGEQDERRELANRYGYCAICGAPRTGMMTEPRPGEFQYDGVCLDDQEHQAW